jgi:hypothetical protein
MLAKPLHAAHPLITEDTGTQGRGAGQIEIAGEGETDRSGALETRTLQTHLAVSYGVRDDVDLILSLGSLRSTSLDGAERETVSGSTDPGLDLKWRFHEAGPLSLAIKAGVVVPTANTAKGLGAGRTGWQTFVVSSYEPDVWGLHLHVGYVRQPNGFGERASIRHVSAALTRIVGRRMRLVADLSSNTHPDPAESREPATGLLGLIYHAQSAFDLDLGLRLGLCECAPDRAILGGMALRF